MLYSCFTHVFLKFFSSFSQVFLMLYSRFTHALTADLLPIYWWAQARTCTSATLLATTPSTTQPSVIKHEEKLVKQRVKYQSSCGCFAALSFLRIDALHSQASAFMPHARRGIGIATRLKLSVEHSTVSFNNVLYVSRNYQTEQFRF